ncbi:MAG: DUF58 domain-containing protein [Clostridiales bacterium]|nr:DUF58 domain-containing protein [Clostridiales bacterium]
MKKRLIPFLIFAFLALLIGLITGNSIYYLILFSLFIVILISVVSLAIIYTHYYYLQNLTPIHGVKGESVDLTMQLHNEYRMPLPLVELVYDLPDSSLTLVPNNSKFGVLDNDVVSINEKIYCKYRGEYQVGIKKVILYDMFGLLKITLDFNKISTFKTLSLVIKPRIVPLSGIPLPFRENSSSHNPIRKPTNDIAEMSDIRQYIQGDILKKVHWKLSFSKQELLVKNYSLSFDPDTIIYLDCSNHSLEGVEAITLEDMIIECATAVSNHLLKSHLPTKLITIDAQRTILTGNNPKDFPAIYEFLSNIKFSSDFMLFDLLSQELSSISHVVSIFIITHTIDTNSFDNLIYLREAAVDVTILLVTQYITSLDDKTRNMISELLSVGVNIINITPSDDISKKIMVRTQ